MRYTPHLRPGDLLEGRYRIVRMLGQGGMGAVFLAEDSRLPGKMWAVKEIAMPAGERDAFAAEARFLAECSHPGLASVVDFLPSEPGQAGFLVMEYIQGESLEDLLRRGVDFGWETVVRIALKLCGVLAYLHEGRPRPIIHRDLKPSNIMLDAQGRLKLIDFGTARHYKAASEKDTVCLGTLGFAAPEQLLGRQTDARTDLYSMGAVMYTLLNGGKILNREADWLPQKKRDAPDGLQEVIERLTAEAPGDRYKSATEAASELEPLLTNGQRSGASVWQPDGVRDSRQLNASRKGRQWIVIGSLTPGSGAGFITMALARVLNRHYLKHAVVEHPGIHPDLYQTLFGERKAPRGYTFRTEKVRYGGGRYGMDGQQEEPGWCDGATEWVPLPPHVPRGSMDWDAAHTTKLMDALEQTVVLIDVGTLWENASVMELCRQATAVYLVCGPSPVHLSRPEATQAWLQLAKLRDNGVKVQILANRSCGFRGKEEWIRSLPDHPVAEVPELPLSELLSCQWSGSLVMDKQQVLDKLDEALKPVIAPVLKASGYRKLSRFRWRFWRGRNP
ncbi:serine/threonine protein kinase [Gorillibacterium sp. sgz5001074]|uniref:serine/threonine protein kinase n=1 Tax=Gorillibacterium sp. sgz5001074 TaxID=3446695 RepID=UPI003F6665F6